VSHDATLTLPDIGITRDASSRAQKLADITAKEELPHGEFGDWLEFYFGWSQRSAQRMIQVAEQFKNDNLSHLPIDTSALYLLSISLRIIRHRHPSH